jgi:hypothetical protein
MIQALLGYFSYKGTIQSLTRATRFITEGERAGGKLSPNYVDEK